MASKIDPTLAKSLITEFRNQNKSAEEHAWKTPDGQHLHGFFINRETLEDILKDKDTVGVHLYLAKHPDFAGKSDKVHTIAIAGAKVNTATNAATPYVNDGDVYDMIPPCPPVCGTI